MRKLSFFKLPFIFVVLFVISNLLETFIKYNSIFRDVVDDFSFLWPIISELILIQLFHLIPVCLLIFVVSSIALYRMNIHIVTLKNISLLIINVCLIKISSILLNQYLQIIYEKSLSNIVSADSWTFSLQFNVISNLLHLGLYCLLTYYYIKIFGSWFDKSKQAFELTKNNSPKIHFVLFLAFFFFLFIIFSSFMLEITIQQTKRNISYWLDIFLPLFIYIITFLIVMMITRNLFKRIFVVLQSDRIIKSAVVTNILILIINVVFLIIAFNTDFFINWINKLGLLILFLYPIVILFSSLILCCLIVRYVTQYYFAHPSKNQMGFK